MTLLERLQSPVSPFFRSVIRICVSTGVVSGSLLIADVPDIVKTLAGYGVAIGIAGASIASITKTDVSDIQDYGTKEKAKLLQKLNNRQKRRDLNVHEAKLKKVVEIAHLQNK